MKFGGKPLDEETEVMCIEVARGSTMKQRGKPEVWREAIEERKESERKMSELRMRLNSEVM